MTAIREITRVKPGHTIEVHIPALQPGEEVEVIVLVGVGTVPEPSQAHRVGRKLKGDWGGMLADLGQQYTSVELQHKAQEWWGD